ncbi:MAG: permease, partial [Acidithiobacillales bacterium]
MKERTKLLLIVGVFLAAYFVPVETPRIQRSFLEGLFLVKEYARQHVLLCLVPALFIAGAIGQFLSQAAVMRYLGSRAPRPVAYGVASVSGSILAVCSCTVLPLFASIYRRGAGLGPATAFLYSGPAINVLAMILTARVLGLELGIARIVGAVGFSIVIGLLMAFLFRKEEAARVANGPDPFAAAGSSAAPRRRSGLQDASLFGAMVAFLVFANWGSPNREVGLFAVIWSIHWPLAAAFAVALAFMVVRWLDRDERREWLLGTWEFAKQILPLLFGGVLLAGWLMGRPGSGAGIIPDAAVTS